jgi:hypothetical protein
MEINTIDFNEIDSKAPNKPGVYAWFIQLPKENNKRERKKHLDLIVEIYEKSIELKGTHFLENYKGHLQLISHEELKSIDVEADVNYNFLNLSLRHFSPPLYIGKANDLATRLKKHSQLYKNRSVRIVEDEDENFKSNFMTRILQNREIPPEMLFLKYVALEEHESKELDVEIELELYIEFLLNRILRPIFGRN